jgi:DNA-binding NarL/FixJ family response regulator
MSTPAAKLGLSERQAEILTLIAAGHGDKIVAGRLHRSEHTIKSQLLRVFEKLQVRTRAAATYQWGKAVAQMGDSRKGDCRKSARSRKVAS